MAEARAVSASTAGHDDRAAVRRGQVLAATAPWLFVLLWSTGFIGAKYGLPYAAPFTFLFLRTICACLLLGIVSLVTRARFPRSPRVVGHVAVSGLLIHAGYLGGVFYAIGHGMPAGLSSLIVGLQPILTAIVAQRLLRERVSPVQWGGLVLGFAGVGLVVEDRATAALGHPIEHGAFVAIAAALLSTTAGALYQKRFVQTVDLAAGATIQYAVTAGVMGVMAVSFESMQIQWTARFVFALAWLVIVLSFGAIMLLLWLIRQHSVSRISSLLYLVPPMTALEAYVLFDERLGVTAGAGMLLVVGGVFLVLREGRRGVKAAS